MTQPADPYVVSLGLQGPPGPVSASVANPAALASVAVTAFAAGSIAYVQSTKTYWTYDPTSTLTPDAVTVIAAIGGGNWVQSSAALAAKAPVTVASGSYAMGAADYWVKAAAGITLTLPASPTVSVRYSIKHYSGSCASSPITLGVGASYNLENPSGVAALGLGATGAITVDGSTTYFRYDGSTMWLD